MHSTSTTALRPARTSAFRDLDSLRVSRLPRGRHSVEIAAVDPSAAFALVTPIEGAGIVHGQRGSAPLTSTELLVIGRGAELVVEAEGTMLIVVIPRDAVGPYSEVLRAVENSLIPMSEGPASLVAHLLKAVSSHALDWTPGVPGRLAQHLVGLVALLCAESPARERLGRDSLLSDAKQYIEAHLAELDLTPDRIALAQNVSTRTLHRIFESHGETISGWVRERRLEHCRADLVDPALSGYSVSMIGARWGLWDAAHFSRLFKVRYGSSPRGYRVHGHKEAELALASA